VSKALLTEAGTQEVVIDAMLGWKRQGMRARYAVSPDLLRQMREALARIEVPPFVGRIEDDTSVPAPR